MGIQREIIAQYSAVRGKATGQKTCQLCMQERVLYRTDHLQNCIMYIHAIDFDGEQLGTSTRAPCKLDRKRFFHVNSTTRESGRRKARGPKGEHRPWQPVAE